ncbi:cytochrome P450 [Flindersiella endophytica]
MNQLRPNVERITTELLDAMESTGAPVDLVQTYAWPMPTIAICQLLGVPYAARERFQRDVRVMSKRDMPRQARIEANLDLLSFLRDVVLQKRAEPADDLLSELVRAGELTHEEIIGIARVVFFGGHETTASMLGLGAFALLQNPDQLSAFVSADENGVDNAVEELLRYLTILQFGVLRVALEDVVLDDVLIKAGDTICVSLPEVNRDPKQFTEPNTLDLARPTAGRHLAFGHGVHQCLGQQLARIELRVGFTQLFRRFPNLRLAVRPDQVRLREDMVHYGVHELPVTW